jgi:hypothetical protein
LVRSSNGYGVRLLELGYAPLSVTRSLTALGHLGRTMDRHDVDVEQLDDDVSPEPAGRGAPLDRFLEEYRDWLAGERALSPDTVRGYTRLAHRFLAERVSAEDELGVERLAGADVTGLLLRDPARVRPGSGCRHANQLRQLLRYLGVRDFAAPGLANAVPSVGRWREVELPVSVDTG